MNNKTKFTLRERKYAKTKLALLDATLESLNDKPFEEITVKELCTATDVSEATFFNYFPNKTGLLTYFIQLWTIEVSWYVEKKLEDGSALDAIETIFTYTAQKSEKNPAIMREIITYQARMSKSPILGDVSPVERALAYPNYAGVETLSARGLDSILPVLVERAVKDGDLPENIDMTMVFAMLTSIFFGTAVLIGKMRSLSLKELYLVQLKTLWAGLNARPKTIMKE